MLFRSDEVQAIKAGLLEVADVFCVNKSDRDGADATVRDLEMMISLGHEVVSAGAHSRRHGAGHLDLARAELRAAEDEWLPPIVKTVASRAEGLDALTAAIARHRGWEEGTDRGAARARERAREELRVVFRELLLDAAHAALAADFELAVGEVQRRASDPYRAAEALVQRFRA